jgi:predicted SprT family Zn-dependent metalloprotease
VPIIASKEKVNTLFSMKGGRAMKNELGQCSICKKEYTSMRVEVTPGVDLYVCSSCIEKAKDNFIWICNSCGKHYMRPKELVISRTRDPELKRAYMLCEDMQIIQGIDMCIECDPGGIVEFMEKKRPSEKC